MSDEQSSSAPASPVLAPKRKSVSRKSTPSAPLRTGEPRVTADQLDLSDFKTVTALAFTSLVDIDVEGADYSTYVKPALDNWDGPLKYAAFCNVCKQILPASYKKVHFQAHVDYLTHSSTCSHHCEPCHSAYLSAKHSSTGFYHTNIFSEAQATANPVFALLRLSLEEGFDEDYLVKLVTNDYADLTPVAPAASKGKRKSISNDSLSSKARSSKSGEAKKGRAPRRRSIETSSDEADDDEVEDDDSADEIIPQIISKRHRAKLDRDAAANKEISLDAAADEHDVIGHVHHDQV